MMTRTLKALGLALATTFAFAAFASAASAVEHHITGKAGEQLTVHSNTKQIFHSTTGEDKGYACKKVSVKGELAKDTNESITVEPQYDECKTIEEKDEKPTQTGKTEIKVDVNECHYTFYGVTTGGEKGNPTGGEHAEVDLTCPAEKSIEITATAFGFKCSTIGPQKIEDAVRYHQVEVTGVTAVEVTATAHGIDSTTQGVCGSGTHNNGEYTGNVIVDTKNGLSLKTT